MLGLPFVAVDAAHRVAGEDRADRARGRPAATSSTTRRPSTPKRPRLAASTAATTSTSSPTPSGPPTGGATTTSPSRSSTRWPSSGSRSRVGSSSAPAPAGRARRSVATCATAATPPGLAVVDPENSAFFPGWHDRDTRVRTDTGSRIEGIGRPRCEPSFIAGVVDRMIQVPDAASIAVARAVEPILGRRVGASTGTNLWGALQLACEMRRRGRARQHRHPALRRRRALPPDLLLRRLGAGPGPRPRAAPRYVPGCPGYR